MGYTSLSSSQHTHGSPGYNRRAAALFVERTGTWRKRDESGLADDDRIQRWPHSACVWSVCVWGGGGGNLRPLCWANTLLWQWTLSKQHNVNTVCAYQTSSHVSVLGDSEKCKTFPELALPSLVIQTNSCYYSGCSTDRFMLW